MSRVAGFFDLAIVPIKTAQADGATARRQPSRRGARKIALIEEAGGVSVEKLLLSGEPAAVQSKAIEMIQSRCKVVLEGFPLEEIAAWCFTHNYRWRCHNEPSSENTFVLEPSRDSCSDAAEPVAIA